MMQCSVCGQMFDETLAAGICPHCGQSVNSAGEAAKKYDDPRWLPAGTVLHERYEVKEVIGAGGFGVTYKVWDLKNSVYKAAKEYFQQGVVNRIPGTTDVLISAPKRREEFEYGRARLLNEARIVAKFQSPSIVRVDDYFEENNTSYMVMEYLELDTLEEYITRKKRVLTVDQAVSIGVNVCNALDEIHRAGVIHRDIAPDNIFITEEGAVKIIDFGSARLSKDDIEDRMIVLKPGFAPPEQYEKIDPSDDKQQAWTDIYALGATLYLALTGKVPAESSNRKADADKNSDSVCYPKEINPNIPDFLNNSIMTAMAVDIHERFKTASEFKQALLQQRKTLPVEVARKRKKARRTIGISSGILLAVLLVVVGGVIYFVNRGQVVLEPASITVWYSVSENDAYAKQKMDVMSAVLEEVHKSDEFSQVSIKAEAIRESVYEDELRKAAESHALPDLFESGSIDLSSDGDLADMKEVQKGIDTSTCVFPDSTLESIASTSRFPIGFCIPVIYINTRHTNGSISVKSLAEFLALDEGTMVYKPVAVKEKDQELFEHLFSDYGEYEQQMNVCSADAFFKGDAAAFFSDTSDYFAVRDALPGSFEMILPDVESITCVFDNHWCIKKGGRVNEMASARLLSHFLQNFVQDNYYLQHSLPGLPVEKKALEEYDDVYPGFAEVLSRIDKYTFLME